VRGVWVAHRGGGRGGGADARKSGHHRRRTVGMVGNDPVMTLTPRIGGRYKARESRACARVCAGEAPSLPVAALSSSRGSPPREPPAGPEVSMMHGETFVFAF